MPSKRAPQQSSTHPEDFISLTDIGMTNTPSGTLMMSAPQITANLLNLLADLLPNKTTHFDRTALYQSCDVLVGSQEGIDEYKLLNGRRIESLSESLSASTRQDAFSTINILRKAFGINAIALHDSGGNLIVSLVRNR